MPLSLTASVEIRAPIQTVFDVVCAPERLPEWNVSVERARRVDPTSPVCVGSRAVFAGRLLGQSVESETEVICYTPPVEFATRAIRGPRITTRFALASVADGTRVTIEATGDVPGGVIGARLAEGFLRSEVGASLARLKLLAEREAQQRAAREPSAGDPACWQHLQPSSDV